MEEDNLLDLNGEDYNEYISDIYMNLIKENEIVISLKKEKDKIYKECDKVARILEGEIIEGLNSEECKLLAKAIIINDDIDNIFQKKIFFQGGKEAYIYFKNIGII